MPCISVNSTKALGIFRPPSIQLLVSSFTFSLWHHPIVFLIRIFVELVSSVRLNCQLVPSILYCRIRSRPCSYPEIESFSPLSFTVLTLESPMTICLDCSINFPLLTEGNTCKKCCLLDSQSNVEKSVINVGCHWFPKQLSLWTALFREKDNARRVHLFIQILSNHCVALVATFTVRNNLIVSI